MTPDPRHALGRNAETQAREWLESRGLSLVARNWRGRGGELDLIMRDGEVLAIIEVRARPGRTHDDARASVNRGKSRRLGAAVREYLAAARLGDTIPVRGDLVTVVGTLDRPDIRWWRNAIRLSL